MARYQATRTAIIDAPAAVVYGIIADYRTGHPRILPARYFDALEVEEGGVGAGTVINFRMRAFGNKRTFRAQITEPEPGRVLVESDIAGGAVTTFTVEPHADGAASRVTIATEGTTRPGLLGTLEGSLTARMLEGVYKEELQLLAAADKEHATTTNGPAAAATDVTADHV